MSLENDRKTSLLEEVSFPRRKELKKSVVSKNGIRERYMCKISLENRLQNVLMANLE